MNIWQKYKTHIFWGVIFLILALCILRVALWENWYYSSKEGSARATSTSLVVDTSEVDETEITSQEIKDYVVAADRPRYLSIPKLDIQNARVLPVGTNADGQMLTPASIYDVGWYDQSSKPGQGGTMIIDGHNGGPTKTGVFKNLPNLAAGDIITIERGDGEIFNYKVVENYTISLADADNDMAKMQTTPEKGKESLSLITCTGEWSQVQQTYLSRQFLRAVLTN